MNSIKHKSTKALSHYCLVSNWTWWSRYLVCEFMFKEKTTCLCPCSSGYMHLYLQPSRGLSTIVSLFTGVVGGLNWVVGWLTLQPVYSWGSTHRVLVGDNILRGWYTNLKVFCLKSPKTYTVFGKLNHSSAIICAATMLYILLVTYALACDMQ